MMNCWEFMDCPKEVRSSCPAYPSNGSNCWKMLSTMCDGGRHELSSISEKVAFCRNCEFYIQHVKNSDIQVSYQDNTSADSANKQAL